MDDKRSVLIVEDEPKIRSGLADFLEFHNFHPTAAQDGLEAKQLVSRHRYDLILLDLMLPKISGEELCCKWRQEGLTTPIIMLTAKGQEREKVAGLNLGADDYITKPFSLEELLARIRAVMRRTDPAKSVGRQFRFGPVAVDLAALKITAAGREQPISPRQGKILQFFAANPGRVISREELYRKVWGESMEEIETRTVDMHIAKLRSIIEANPAEPALIRTVRGAGYVYEANHESV
ncbi:MAG TPA: response regulator transcription factor [Anaerohalosphaeraceae bacterium]|nr:response regulator transcription factor [Anaerohalosphaeraceae bacterium]HRT51638.1 response regulator transcription factor [Anaerohalosphaeraceae bacterium]HRT87347.1 response regulator transcription factor [Anaerohalosphaeraceae bacterium]